MTPAAESGARAVVIGGGLSGISAALQLLANGWRVTLLEARPRLGGAAYSFNRGGLTIDTGQHVLLRCYTDYLGLVQRIGAQDQVLVQPRLDLPVLRPGAPPARLRRSLTAPAPVHLLPALLGYSVLSMGERIRAAKAMAALSRVDPDDPDNDRMTFGTWLRQRGQSHRSLTGLWGLIAVGALNIDLDEASLALAARVFRTGLIEGRRAGDLGMPVVPLGEIHDRATRRHLRAVGIAIHDHERVLRIDHAEDAFQVRTATGELTADAIVVAVPHRQAAELVPATACPDRDRWAGLGSSAIVNVHVRYDRPVTDLPFAAVLDSPVQWFFDRTVAARSPGQYLVMPVSAAGIVCQQPAEQLVAAHLEALGHLLPGTRGAKVVDSFVTREPHATFRQAAGTAALRPPALTRVRGLVLAGAWTATGWPDTLEGAVRSGLTAARVIGSPVPVARSVMQR